MPDTPRGIRNNNPGNIRHSQIAWDGEAVDQSDPDFIQFQTPEYGIRAIVKIFLTYQKKGINTIHLAIDRWAPSSENDTQAYVEALCKAIPCGPNDPLVFCNVFSQLVRAIILHENGVQPYDNETISHGILMGLGEST